MTWSTARSRAATVAVPDGWEEAPTTALRVAGRGTSWLLATGAPPPPPSGLRCRHLGPGTGPFGRRPFPVGLRMSHDCLRIAQPVRPSHDLRPEVRRAGHRQGRVTTLSAVEQQPSGSTPATPLGYPDIVLAGAARSGTTFLAARLSRHPAIDGGAVKEPDFFSKHLSRGTEWYDGLFTSRKDGLLRLDASMSYTVPQYPEALNQLAAAAPHAFVIYAVRDPLARAVSHYRLLRDYFHVDSHTDFGSALRDNPVYLGTSDYSHWLPQLYGHWPKERVLVAPFAVTTRGNELPDRSEEHTS